VGEEHLYHSVVVCNSQTVLGAEGCHQLRIVVVGLEGGCLQ